MIAPARVRDREVRDERQGAGQEKPWPLAADQEGRRGEGDGDALAGTDGLPPLDNHNPDSTISQLRDGRLLATPRLPDGMKAAEWPVAE